MTCSLDPYDILRQLLNVIDSSHSHEDIGRIVSRRRPVIEAVLRGETPDRRPSAKDDGWQPIETAVYDNKARLVWCPDRQNIYAVCWDDYKTQWVIFGTSHRLNEFPTHWRPLPSPPVSGAKP